MKITTLCTFLLCALVLPLSAQKKADKQAITDLIEQYETGLNTRSLDGVMAIFSPDAVVLVNDAPPAIGTAAIHERYKSLTDPSNTLAISLAVQDMIFAGDVAYGWMMNTGTFSGAGGEGTIDSKSLVIFRKGKDGWRVDRYMFNSNSAD